MANGGHTIHTQPYTRIQLPYTPPPGQFAAIILVTAAVTDCQLGGALRSLSSACPTLSRLFLPLIRPPAGQPPVSSLQHPAPTQAAKHLHHAPCHLAPGTLHRARRPLYMPSIFRQGIYTYRAFPLQIYRRFIHIQSYTNF